VNPVAPSMDGRTVVGVSNSASGEVSGDTVFHYREHDGAVWAEYAGGASGAGSLQTSRAFSGAARVSDAARP
jgi:hypothetical protein